MEDKVEFQEKKKKKQQGTSGVFHRSSFVDPSKMTYGI